MNPFIRIQPLRSAVARPFIITNTRSIVLVRGDRVRGAIRDPEEYLTVKGHRYGNTQENLQYIKSYLTKIANGKYLVPDELLLQIITHKSFSHGSQPYNDKLSIIGFQLLKTFTSVFAITRPTHNQFAVNNMNFDCLGSMVAKNLLNDKCLAQFARQTGISNVVFWKKALRLNHDPKSSGEDRIFSSVTGALVGLINLHHGLSAAQEFIRLELLENTNTSIINSAVSLTKLALEGKKSKKQTSSTENEA